jgi:ferric-dicitrate binding protein FerR (iron transport regulator)
MYDKKIYTAGELLQNDDFVASQLHPTGESEAHWRELVESGAVGRSEFDFARSFVFAVQAAPDNISDEDVFALWAGIEVANKAEMKRRGLRLRLVSLVTGVAAMLAFAVLITDSARHRSESFSPLFAADEALEAGADVQLYLSEDHSISFGGSEVRLEYGEEGITAGGNGVVVARESAARSGSLYHQLVVPLGKRSRVTFPDGTVVWVNAGSRIAFATDFDRRQREIYVDGRAYLEVTPDKRKPFTVKTTRMDVEVMGTIFDIDAYDHQNSQRVVLVDGSVRVRGADNDKRETVLTPGEMYLQSNGISKVSAVDVAKFISWKDGLFFYQGEMLESIAKHLSEYYGYGIVCSRDVSQIRFSGKLDLKARLDDVLEGLSRSAPIAFSRNEGIYTITDK